MKIKTTLAVLALTIAPTLALAQGCEQYRMKSASQCGAGQAWDAAKQACAPVVNS